MAKKTADYEAEKQKLREFLTGFTTQDDQGRKKFKYAEQLTALAHREQVSIHIDLDDVAEHDEDLADAIRENTRRYNMLAAEIIESLLPDYKEREVPARDALDVFIQHRHLMESRRAEGLQPGEQAAKTTFPPELMRRYEVYVKSRNDDSHSRSCSPLVSRVTCCIFTIEVRSVPDLSRTSHVNWVWRQVDRSQQSSQCVWCERVGSVLFSSVVYRVVGAGSSSHSQLTAPVERHLL